MYIDQANISTDYHPATSGTTSAIAPFQHTIDDNDEVAGTRIVLVFVHATSSDTPPYSNGRTNVDSLTFNGQSMTRLADSTLTGLCSFSGSHWISEVWYIEHPDPGISLEVKGTFRAATIQGYVASAVTVHDIHSYGTGWLLNVDNGASGFGCVQSDSVSLDIVAQATDSLVVGGYVQSYHTAPTMDAETKSPGGSNTELYGIKTGADAPGDLVAELGYLENLATGTTSNMTWSAAGASRYYNSIFVELRGVDLSQFDSTPPVVNELQPLQFYLAVVQPETVFTGRVNGALSEPYNSITWDGGATGTAGTTTGGPIIANTVAFGTTAGGKERGIVRMRSWTPASSTDPSTGTLVVAENDDVTPFVEDDDYITIRQEHRLWPINPRFVQSGSTVTAYEDYDIAYTDQTENWFPLAVAGPPAVVFLAGGSATVSFVGDRSRAIAPGATLTGWAWTAFGSSEVTSSSQGTEASPVVFTYTAAGQYLVELEVTDSNGNVDLAYTWVIVIDEASPEDTVFTDFDSFGDNSDRGSNGGECNFVARGVASASQFPDDALVIYATKGTPTGASDNSWPFRTNIMFTGFVTNATINQEADNSNTVNFRASGVNKIMDAIKPYSVSLTSDDTPSSWFEGKDLTIDRVFVYLSRFRSTLGLMTPIILSDLVEEVYAIDFPASSLLQQIQAGLLDDAWARLVVNHQGVIYIEREFNWMLTAERNATEAGNKTLHKGVWANRVSIQERADYDTPTAKVKTGGVYYPGTGGATAAQTFFSEAPGDLVRPFGGETGRQTYILDTQDNLNIRTGFMLARDNIRYTNVQMSFLSDCSFGIAPQRRYNAVIEPTDNNRGLSWTPVLIPQRISRRFDHETGVIEVQVEFEPSVTGPAGVTVNLDQPSTSFEPPPLEYPLPTDSLAMLAFSPEFGTYYRALGGETWENRNAGLTGTEVHDRWGGGDPWWFTATKANGFNPDNVIIWKSTPGQLHRSVDGGRLSWSDVTPTGTFSDSAFVQLASDPFNNQVHWWAEYYTDASGTYNSRLHRTTDDGSTWNTTDVS